MARKYDFKKAKAIIEENKDKLLSADLGMSEDWYYTAEEIWNGEDGYVVDLDTAQVIAGINGSAWATPVLRLSFSNGQYQDFECHDNGEYNPLSRPSWV